MSDPVLRIDGVTKRFGRVTAVDRASLEVSREFFALLGPSGSGKTTLLRIIAGLEAPDEGRVLIDGQDVTRLAPYARKIGMVFQDFLLFPHKTVAENIVFPLRMQRVNKPKRAQRLAWIIDLMRLNGLEDRYPSQLSGGQQQRVALARGLIAEPVLLLLDEPLANLDRELRKEMEVEVRRYQTQLDIPFIYVTHNQEEALTMSDRVAVMRDGAFEQVAPKLEVYANPASPFVAGFVGQSNRIRGRLIGMDGPAARVAWNGTELLTPSPPGTRQGDAVDYFLKCERIAVAPVAEAPPSGRVNRVEGELRDIIFKGQTADYLVTLDNGAELVVSESKAIPRVSAKDRVVLTWTPEEGNCFRAEEAEP